MVLVLRFLRFAVPLRVFLVDGSSKVLNVDSYALVQDVMDQMVETISVFWLWICFRFTFVWCCVVQSAKLALTFNAPCALFEAEPGTGKRIQIHTEFNCSMSCTLQLAGRWRSRSAF